MKKQKKLLTNLKISLYESRHLLSSLKKSLQDQKIKRERSEENNPPPPPSN